ncbi:acyltransferase family protein [Elongatibacter sediminis]|uniref:Acyltransferase family protein n=1 Tax=Elongatibacter sediminis TaxID=3119006 RepID=A0AAW9RF21_9GAMM
MRKLAYRADVDGLRAVAVVAVIASHLPEKFLPSGFLGVDVFFAISGYVVTASLMSQRRTQLAQLYAGFLSRRVRRLLPALAVCVAVTGSVVLATDPFPAASVETGLAALFGFGNIVLFFFELDYFSPSSLFNAFTHTWSLGVEEQFYVVFPAFVWLFYFRPGARSFRLLGLAMIVGGLISITLFAGLYGEHQAAAFFLMPARIWELGVGSLVFLGRRHLQAPRIQAALRPLSPLVLLALIACFLVPEHHHMPATIVAVFLAATLLASERNSPAARILSFSPTVYVGKISYSLYLWHWPAIALGPIVLAAGWRHSAVYVLIAAIAAVLSYHAIEKPLRYATWSGRRVGDIALGATGNALIAGMLMFAMAGTGAQSATATASLHPPPYLPVRPSGKSHKRTCALDGGSRKLTPDTVTDCTLPPRPGSSMPTIWTMGDSHSGHLQGMLYELHDRLGVGVHLVETPGWPYPFEPGTQFVPRKELYSRIRPLFEAGDIVLIARIYISRSTPHTVKEIRPWLHDVGRLADDLAARGVSLVITGPSPIFPFKDIRECSLDEREICRLQRDAFEPLVESVTDRLTQLEKEHANVVVFKLFDTVCPRSDGYCYPDNGSSFLYRDRDHFNSLGSRLLAEPFVDLLRSSALIRPGQ